MSLPWLTVKDILYNEVGQRLDTSNDKLTDIQNKLAQPTYLKSASVVFDNSANTSPNTYQLFSNSTPSRFATICRDVNDTGNAWIGDANTQAFPINPGDCIMTSISDLSNIYVKVDAGAKATLYVLYEV